MIQIGNTVAKTSNKRLQTDTKSSVFCVTRYAQTLTQKHSCFGAAEAGVISLEQIMRKQRVSALIVNCKNAEILLIKRFKEGRNYWVFPGGGVEPEERLEQAMFERFLKKPVCESTTIKKCFQS